MAWKAGAPLTIAATNVRQQLTTTVGLVKAIRIFPPPSGGHTIYIGDITLDTTAAPIVGLLGWIPATPAAPGFEPFVEGYEAQSMNGIFANAIYISGTQGDYCYFSYLEQ